MARRKGGRSREIDRVGNALCVFEHLAIGEADDTKTMLNKPTRTPLVMSDLGILCVRHAVKLDDKARLRAKEVCHVRTNWCLPAKAKSCKLFASQYPPELSLGVGHIPAQFACSEIGHAPPFRLRALRTRIHLPPRFAGGRLNQVQAMRELSEKFV